MVQGTGLIATSYNDFFQAKGKYFWDLSGSIKEFKEAAKINRVDSFSVEISSKTKETTTSTFSQEVYFFFIFLFLIFFNFN
jgi:hypothetical protein